jgi:pimeloyl-ACP methyl ester carboxylesterase
LIELFGDQVNLIGFDPRGINNSGPLVDCFGKNSDARAAFEDDFFTDVSNASSTSLNTQFYASDLFGQWCTNAIRQDESGKYISTPAVAQDMLSYTRAEQTAAGKPEADAKLWYFGVSYGTALGATFASLFPDNVGRLILDGVIDAEDYYNLGWRSNLFDTDKALDSFATYCHQGGPQNCSFWGPTPQNITDRLDNILAKLKNHPIPVTGLQPGSTPGLATYSDLKQVLFTALYNPSQSFPGVADTLLALEQGNGSSLTPAPSLVIGPDVSQLIKCVDGYNRGNYSTLQDFENYIEILNAQSHYFGEVWPNNADGVLCRSFDADLPHGSFPGKEQLLIPKP